MDTTTAYSTSFAALPRQKALAIWSTHQVAVAFIIIAFFSVGLATGMQPFSPITVVLAVILVLDLLVIHRMSVWQVLAIRFGFLLLQATGKAEATISPLTVDTTVGLLDLPGADGKHMHLYEIVNTEYAGSCFIWDEAHTQATASLHLLGLNAELSGADHVNTLAKAFSAALRSLADQDDVIRVTVQSRSLRHPLTPRVSEAGDVSFASEDIRTVETQLIAMPLRHDYVVTITIRPRVATAHEVSVQLNHRVEQFTASLLPAGIKPYSIHWLSVAELRGLMKTMTDPHAALLLDDSGGLPDTIPVASSWRAHGSYMQIGSTLARTYWIDQWPRDAVPVGWITQITASLNVQFIFTQVFRSRNHHDAKNSVERQLNETDTMRAFTARLGRQADRKTDEEIIQLDQHLRDIEKDNSDVQFQGFLTVLAGSVDELEANCRTVNAAKGDLLHFDTMINQQLTRFNGAYPLGLEGSNA